MMATRSPTSIGRSRSRVRQAAERAIPRPRYLRSLRLPALVLEIAAAGAEGLTAEELLARPTLRRLYNTAGDATRQAFNRDLRTLGGGVSLRELKRDGLTQHDEALLSLVAYDSTTGRFRLRTPMPTLHLTPAALEALCLLAHGLRAGEVIPGAAELFDGLLAALPAQQQVELGKAMGDESASESGSGARAMLRLEVGPLGGDVIDQEALGEVLRAMRRRQCLDFDYRPLGSAPERVTHHRDDEVLEVRVADHVYVAVWCETVGRDLDLRLDRIVAGTPRLSPRTVSDRRRRGVAIRYWLSPKLASGEVSVRLEGQQVERQSDGSAIVSGRARSLFWAEQLLLKYGVGARALEPRGLVERMRQTVEAMAGSYGEALEEASPGGKENPRSG